MHWLIYCFTENGVKLTDLVLSVSSLLVKKKNKEKEKSLPNVTGDDKKTARHRTILLFNRLLITFYKMIFLGIEHT